MRSALVALVMAALFGVANYWHTSTMFESSRHFSHLSQLEREMSLRTEAGFYYSYYKRVVEARSAPRALRALRHDTLVEHPDEVDALARFNIWPEVIIGYMYRIYIYYCNLHNIENKQCWTVKRNDGLPDIVSCEGIGEPIYFYLHFIWIFAGLTTCFIFIYSLYICKNLYGAMLAVVFYFYNHSEATRVQWSPPLRENFAFPFILLNSMAVTLFLHRMVLKKFQMNILQVWMLGISSCVCLVLWQFSQFIMTTQIGILFVMEQMKFITQHMYFMFLSSHLIGIYLSFIIMQGNGMLMSSFYLSLMCSLCMNYLLWNFFIPKIKETPLFKYIFFRIFMNVTIVFFLTLIFKTKFMSLIGNKDDSHIVYLLQSKFTNFKNFHTMLYTCSSEFDYLPLSSIWNLTSTLLLPCSLFAIIVVFIFWVNNALNIDLKNRKSKEEKNNHNRKLCNTKENHETNSDELKKESKTQLSDYDKKNSEKNVKQIDVRTNVSKLEFFSNFSKCLKKEPEIVFNIFQLFVYFIMAVLIMRLKLFLTPQLCVISSLITSSKYYPRYTNIHVKIHVILFAFVLMAASYRGITNITTQRTIVGEYSNEYMEELITWINTSTEKNAAFAGPMPITSAIMLSTRRPIVNHPHYEDAGLRARTMMVYSAFSRQSVDELYSKLSKLKVTYLVIDHLWCFHKSTNGCTMLDIWDVEQPHLKTLPSICHKLYSSDNVPHFQKVFANGQFIVLRVHDNIVNIKLRNYEWHSM